MDKTYDIKAIHKVLLKQDKTLGKWIKKLPEFNLQPSSRYF